LTFGHSGTHDWAPECPNVKNLKCWVTPLWHWTIWTAAIWNSWRWRVNSTFCVNYWDCQLLILLLEESFIGFHSWALQQCSQCYCAACDSR